MICRRSASLAYAEGTGETAVRTANDWPQSPQNRCPGGFWAPQRPQPADDNGQPQAAQAVAKELFSAVQRWQRMMSATAALVDGNRQHRPHPVQPGRANQTRVFTWGSLTWHGHLDLYRLTFLRRQGQRPR